MPDWRRADRDDEWIDKFCKIALAIIGVVVFGCVLLTQCSCVSRAGWNAERVSDLYRSTENIREATQKNELNTKALVDANRDLSEAQRRAWMGDRGGVSQPREAPAPSTFSDDIPGWLWALLPVAFGAIGLPPFLANKLQDAKRSRA